MLVLQCQTTSKKVSTKATSDAGHDDSENGIDEEKRSDAEYACMLMQGVLRL